MHIEQVQLTVTLKAGEKIWAKGEVISSPIPHELLDEVKLNTGTVKVLKQADVKKDVLFETVPDTKEDLYVDTVTEAAEEQEGVYIPEKPARRGRPPRKE